LFNLIVITRRACYIKPLQRWGEDTLGAAERAPRTFEETFMLVFSM
jgi:hypothetical protein